MQARISDAFNTHQFNTFSSIQSWLIHLITSLTARSVGQGCAGHRCVTENCRTRVFFR